MDNHSLHLTHLTEQNDKSRKFGVGFHQGTTSQKTKMTGWMIFKPDEKLWSEKW